METVKEVIHGRLYFMYEVVHQKLADQFRWKYQPYTRPFARDDIIVTACEYASLYGDIMKMQGSPKLIVDLHDEAIELFIRYWNRSHDG